MFVEIERARGALVDLSRARLEHTALRGANLVDADLGDALSLTQGQIDHARGNSKTRLPPNLTRPASWE